MTSIDDLKHDVKNAQNNVLGGLDTEERLRLFIQEAAEDREERIEWLADTAPQYQYTATDLEYTDGTKKVGMLSLLARHQLQQNYQAIDQHETARDKYVALMVLNETLSRLSRGEFEIDEFGDIGAPNHDDADYAYGKKSSRDTAFLATKYRELWEDLPAELLLDEADRDREQYFPNLAAGGLMAYRTDLSGEAFDDLEDDRISSEVYLSELRLLNALIDFYVNFHGWRLFAEDHLGVTLDKFLDVPILGDDDVSSSSVVLEIDEQLCRNILSLKRDYLEAYPSLLKELADADSLEDLDEEVTADLDARAQEFADALAEEGDLPV